MQKCLQELGMGGSRPVSSGEKAPCCPQSFDLIQVPDVQPQKVIQIRPILIMVLWETGAVFETSVLNNFQNDPTIEIPVPPYLLGNFSETFVRLNTT